MIKSKKTGQVIVISSPSGGGKSSITAGLLKNNKNLWLSISDTSREIRPNDNPGVNYNFITKEEFEKRIKKGHYLEYTNYVGNYYGTPKKAIKEHLDKGIDVILEIEIEGASNIKKLIPEAIFIFIMPPSIKELARRLKNRKTESMDKMLARFHKTYQELNEVTKYNYVVVNDDLDLAIKKVEAIITAEKCSVDRIEEVFLDTKEEEIHELLMDEEFDNSPIGEKL